MAEEAYDVMKNVINKPRDKYQIYKEHIVCKLKNLPTDYSRNTVQHLFNNIIYEAQIGKYNDPSRYYPQQLEGHLFNRYDQYSNTSTISSQQGILTSQISSPVNTSEVNQNVVPTTPEFYK